MLSKLFGSKRARTKVSIFLMLVVCVLFVGMLVMAAHTSSSSITPTWTKGEISQEFTITVANNGVDAIEWVRMTKPTEYGDITNCIAPTNWGIGEQTTFYCQFYTTTDTIPSGNSRNFKVVLPTASIERIYSWQVKTKDISESYYTGTVDSKIDNTVPTAAITYSDSDGIVKAGDSLTITATFNEDMAESPVPKIGISGANTVAAIGMTKTDATHYYHVHTVGAGDGTATVALSIGTDLAGNVITSVPTSGATFIVDNTNPTIEVNTLTDPNGAEAIKGGSTFAITWTAGHITDTNLETNPITLEYSTDSGSTWNSIATGEANDGTYDWTVPTIDYTGVKIRITATDIVGNSASDESDVAFTIDSINPFINTYTLDNLIISPNGDGITDSAIIDLEFSEQVSADVNILDNSEVKVHDLYSSASVTDPQASSTTWDGTGNTGDGIYTIQIIITDGAGNSITNTTKTITVDTEIVYVDDSGEAGYTTIQAAIDAAGEGDTVQVAAGTYTEYLDINKPLTLQGAGVGITIIDMSGETSGSAQDVVDIDLSSGNVIFDGFEIRLGVSMSAIDPQSSDSSSVITISNNKIIGYADYVCLDENIDYGVLVQSNAGKIVVDNNEINTNCNPVLIERSTGATEIINNILSAKQNSAGIWLMTLYGIDVTSLQNISGNEITILGNEKATGGIGIRTSPVYGNPANTAGKFTNIEITNNVIIDILENTYGIKILNDKNDGTPATAEISGTLITGNTISGSAGTGIILGGLLVDTNINDNTISGIDTGIKVYEGSTTSNYPTGTLINENKITGCGTYGLNWEGSSLLDATINWWGFASGPATEYVVGNVGYTPWAYNIDMDIDETEPTGGSVSYTDGYETDTTAIVNVVKGTDSDSGVNSVQLYKKEAALSDGTCGAFGGLATEGTQSTGATSISVTTASGKCYMFEYKSTNLAGLTATYTSTEVLKVDTTEPTGGSVSYTDGYETTTTATVNVDEGTDDASGVSSVQLYKKEATLTNDVCGTYEDWAAYGTQTTDTSSVDVTTISGKCYMFEYKSTNLAGLTATYISTNELKVDADKPTTGDDSVETIQVPTYTVTITPTDTGGSGIASTKYCVGAVNCDPTTDLAGAIAISTRGVNYLRYYSVDVAGNSQTIVSKTININNPPEVTDVVISPSSPVTTNDLGLTYLFSDLDAEHTDLVLETNSLIEWYKNNVNQSSYYGLTTVPFSATAKGETWYVKITPNDGRESGTTVQSNSVTIQNTVPTTPTVDVTDTAYTTDDLICSASGSTDVDTADSVDYSYAWSKGGGVLETTQILSSDLTAKGETWKCVVTPNDGTADGTTQEDSVTILNTAPVASSLSLTASPYTTDDLVASYNYADADTDAESGTEIRWYKNNEPQNAYNNDKTIPFANTLKGEIWYFTVTPKDGTTDFGDLKTSATITIQNTIPGAPTIGITPTQPYVIDNLTCVITANSTDADDDTLTYSYAWYNGTTLTSETTSSISSSLTAKGEVWKCIVTPSDGEDGTSTESSTVTIGVLETNSIVLSATELTIAADGSSTSVITATLKDGVGVAVLNGTSVTMSTNKGSLNKLSATSGNGAVQFTLTSAISTGIATITVGSYGITKTINITFEAGTFGMIELTANPTSITADGVSISTITAQIADSYGNDISSEGVEILFGTTSGTFTGESSIIANTNINGQAVAVLTAPEGAYGTATITSTKGLVSKNIVITLTSPTFNNRVNLIGDKWNLVSVPKELENADVGVVFQTTDRVFYYDSTTKLWSYKYLGEGYLTNINPLKGYWVKPVADKTLTLTYKQVGNIPPLPPSQSLVAGWNLIGHGSVITMSVENALSAIDGKYAFVLQYNQNTGAWQTYSVSGIKEFTTMKPGYGYWIFMKESGIYAVGA